MKRFLQFILFLFFTNTAICQLIVHQSDLTIQSGATITVQGDMSSTKNITSFGKIVFNGTDSQSVNMNGNSFYNVEINNPSNIYLTGDAKVSNSLLFTNGKIIDSNYNFSLADIAAVTGMGDGKFIETNGSGKVFKEISADVTSSEIPVGAGALYRPVFITTSGTYDSGKTKVGVQFLDSASVYKPQMTSDFLNANWNISQTGITGSLNVAARYNDADISGSENNLKGYLFDGIDWSSVSGTVNAATNTITFPITISSANITAIDKFDLLKSKAFLQGAYDADAGLMTDDLRTNNLIPLSDPYRTSPYNTAFTQVNDANVETVAPAVFADQSLQNDNVVDWVFLELRDATQGSNILQTRSALIQRDGDIVDVDGKSAVTFNNVPSGNYTIAIRHRNHLGISTDPATFTPPLDEKNSTVALVDFTTSKNIYGGSSAYGVSSDGKNMLWGGNANMDGVVNFTSLQNDKDYIFLNGLQGNTDLILSNIYSPSDINMDGTCNFNGLSNDKDFLYKIILGNSTFQMRNQSLP